MDQIKDGCGPRFRVASMLLAAICALALATQSRAQSLAQHASSTAYSDRQVQMPHLGSPRRPAARQQQVEAADSPRPQTADAVFRPKGSRPIAAATPPTTAAERRPATTPLRRAARGEVIDELPPPGLVRRDNGQRRVQQATHLHALEAEYAEPIYEGEVACGVEPGCGLPVCSCCGPGSGVGVGCGLEPACGLDAVGGIEPACGVDFGGCDGPGCCDDYVDFCMPVFRVNWRLYEFFGGVNGFTGPASIADNHDLRAGGSSFGFFEGFNRGQSLGRLFCLDLASQFGLRATQSSLSGSALSQDVRRQIFVTGGFFRRVDYGLQYGAVVDYQYDDWWFRTNLTQVRGELSWNDACGREYGYQFMIGTKTSTSTALVQGNEFDVRLAAIDQHRLFFRGQTAGGGQYQVFGGGTGHGDGLLGGSMTSAFRGRFATYGGFTYLIPSASRRNDGFMDEAWNLAIGVVFRPGGPAGPGRYARPMFDVADNGTFLVRQR